MDKAQLRRHLRVRLRALTDDERRAKSLIISETFVTSIDWSTIHSVSCYQSQDSLCEVDTEPILQYMRDNHPAITVDLIEPDSAAALPRMQYDLIIVPVLGFDDQCNRLGRGGGWYDRFLATQDSAQTIGLAFTLQHIDAIPVEDFDVELDDIITED